MESREEKTLQSQTASATQDIIKSNEKRTHGISINGEKIEINHQVNAELNRFTNQVYHSARKRHTCAQHDYHKCPGDCVNCYYVQQGPMIALEQISEQEYDRISFEIYGSSSDAIENITTNMFMESIYDFAKESVSQGDLILKLRFIDDLSFKNIAKLLGTHETSILRRCNKLIHLLREQSEDFF